MKTIIIEEEIKTLAKSIYAEKLTLTCNDHTMLVLDELNVKHNFTKLEKDKVIMMILKVTRFYHPKKTFNTIEAENTEKENAKIKIDKVVNYHKVLKRIVSELVPIDFHNLIGVENDKDLKKKHFVVEAINEILNVAIKLGYDLCNRNENIYLFNGTYWQIMSKSEIRYFLGKAALKLGVDKYEAQYHSFQTDLLNQFEIAAFSQNLWNASENVAINLRNGTYIFEKTGHRLKPFSPNDFFTYQLPFDYNAQAICPIFDSFLEKVLQDKAQQKILSEFIAYVFIKTKTLKLEKCLILYGSGANGKSVFFDVINALLGKENVTNFSLQALTDSKGYDRAQISNKLLNYGSEISTHMDPTYFKQLVSGEPVSARSPYGKPFIMHDYAKFMFNTNTLPKDVEQTDAFFRRFLLINFAETIPDNERDAELSQKIIANELPGVFNWVLSGLESLLVNRGFTTSEAVEKFVRDYRNSSDSVILFLEDERYESSVDNEISLKSFYKHYKSYCEDSGYKPTSKKNCSSRLLALKFKIHRRNFGMVIDAKKVA